MAKFLYFQDGHVKGKNSINRLGDFFSDWLIKFDELLEIAKKNKVEAIIDGGDLFDSPMVSYSVCDAIVDRVEKAKMRYICLFGNHAERYHSKEHSYDTTLAHILRRSKYFEYLETTVGVGKDYVIQGIEYSHTVEENIKDKGIFLQAVSPKAWRIAIVHAFICPKPFPYASHVVCDDIKTNADLVLVAHYHKVWEKKVADTQYLDIGCFGRNSITEADIKPSCVLLDTEERSYKVIPLKSAKKGADIFDLAKIEELKASDVNMENFIKSLESVQFQGQNIESIIKDIATKENIPQEVVSLIMQKMELFK